MFNLKQNQQGLAAIEMTLVLPVLLLFFFATAEFSRLLYQYNALTKVIRNASRYMSNNALNGANILDLTDTITINATDIMASGDLTKALQILPNLKDASVSIATSEDKFITMTVSYQWQPIFASTLPSFVNDTSFDLSFPLVTTYTMRAIQ